MKPEERQKLNMAVAKIREASAAAEREIQLRREAQELLQQVLETTYTVERPENPNPTVAVGPAPIIPATPDAVQSPNSPNQNSSGSYVSSTSSSSAGSDNWPPRCIPIPSSSPNNPNRSPLTMSPTTSDYNSSPSSGSRNNQTPGILRPCPSPGSNNPGRNFNRGRRVTFEDTSQSSCSSADSPVNFSQSSQESSPTGGRNCGRPVTAGSLRSYRRTEPFYNSRFPQQQNYVADSSSTSSSSSSSRNRSFPDNLVSSSSGFPDFSVSEVSSRPATAPSSSASARPSSLQEWIDRTASSSTGTGTIPGTTAFADVNSSRVESTCSSTSTSTQSAVYCPHCRRPLNMNVNIQAPVDTSNSSEQNMRIRINFFEDSRSGLDGSTNSRSRGASNLSGLSNPMGLNCPHCYRRIHLRLNVQQNQNTNDSEQEFNVQIGLLTSPDPGSRNDSSNYLSSANSYSVPLSVLNCGDGPPDPDNPGVPKPPDDKC